MASRAYSPRHPHDTILHRLVREHLASFVAFTESAYSAPLPRYVTDAFERYLACGDFSRGFVRCHCDACKHDVLVPFSCKQRGLCPSCGARRMCDEAAHITDCILPCRRPRRSAESERVLGRGGRRAVVWRAGVTGKRRGPRCQPEPSGRRDVTVRDAPDHRAG